VSRRSQARYSFALLNNATTRKPIGINLSLIAILYGDQTKIQSDDSIVCERKERINPKETVAFLSIVYNCSVEGEPVVDQTGVHEVGSKEIHWLPIAELTPETCSTPSGTGLPLALSTQVRAS
jgi:hypothetical protein